MTANASELTARLMTDHNAINRELETLRTKLDDTDWLGEAELFTRLEESLNSHFKTEEQLLFPLLRRSLGLGVCDKLSNEHAKMLRIAKKITGQTGPSDNFVAQLNQMFHAHTYTEENVLFWYLDTQPELDRAH